MGATDWLATLNFGLSTGGAPGFAETTLTLGTPRLDRREPPSQYYFGGLQVTRMSELLMLMSGDLKGGTRLRVRTQTTSPFGAQESGFWIDSAGNPKYTYNGSNYTLAGGSANTLSGAYNAGGGPSDSIITLNATGSLVGIQDAASTIGPVLFKVGSNAFANIFLSIANDGSNTVSRSTGLTANPEGSTATRYALLFDNPVAATAGVPAQYSPGLELRSSAWDTGASAARDHRWLLDARPVSGNPTSHELVFFRRYNSGNYTEQWRSRDASTAAARWTMMTSAPKFYSEATTGAQPAFLYDTANAYAGVENIAEWRDVGVKAFGVRPSSSGPRIQGYSSTSGAATSYVELLAATLQVQAGIAVLPETSVASGALVGSSTKIWREGWFRTRGGVEQTAPSSATPSFDTTLGDSIYILLNANATSWSITSGVAGQQVRIAWAQDGVGGRSIAGTPSNVKLQGGTFSPSTTPGAIDILELGWSVVDSKWHETGRKRNDGASSRTALLLGYQNAARSADHLPQMSTTGGPLALKGDAAALQSTLFAGQTNGAGAGVWNLWQFTQDTTHTLKSNVPNSGTNVGVVVDTLQALTGTTLLTSFRNNNVPKFEVGQDGMIYCAGSTGLKQIGGTGRIACGSTDFSFLAGGWLPNNDNTTGQTLGAAAKRWKQCYATQLISTVLVTSASGAVTADTLVAGELKSYTMSANVTSVTMSAGTSGQRCTLSFAQDGTVGTYTIASWSGAKLTGGAFTPTTGVNIISSISFYYNGTTWIETGRAMNQT